MRHSKRRDEIVRLLADGKQRGLTYAEIAASAGLARSTVAAWAWRLRREERERAPIGAGFVELVAAAPAESTRVETRSDPVVGWPWRPTSTATSSQR